MPRRPKQKVTINNPDSLEGLLQEVYSDACRQSNDAQRIINELTNSVKIETVDDATKVAKEKTNAQKIKDSAVKIKLEVAKLQKEILKNNGNVEETLKETTGKESLNDSMKDLRKYLKEAAKNNDLDSGDEE